MFADELRRAIEAASRITLPQVTALLWRTYGDGKVTEAEAESLSGLIEARTNASAARRQPTATPAEIPGASQDRQSSPRKPGVGSRPRTDASMERRRRWAASGRMPLAIVARFTLAEQAVLSLVAAEVARRKDCRLSIENMAAIAGVCRSTVKNAIREAARLSLLTVEERQISGFRNDTNVLRIVSPEWVAWLRLARKENAAWSPFTRGEGHRGPAFQREGVKSVTSTPTKDITLSESRKTEPKAGCRKAAGDLNQAKFSRIRVGGRASGAMR